MGQWIQTPSIDKSRDGETAEHLMYFGGADGAELEAY